MDKEEALNDFLKGLRIVLSNALAYSKDHPYLIKSVENFKQKIDALFTFLSPIKIYIAVDSLFIDGRKLEKVVLYVELAQIFHQRKIKSIELRQGLVIEELIDFINGISLPIKEILRQKGLKNILDREKNPHVVVDDLDYSQLLGGEGEEVKEVWIYLFKEAIERKDSERINEFADNFEKILGKFKAKDLLEDEELKKGLYDFLFYLRDNQKDKFYNCAGKMFNSFAKYKDIFDEKNLNSMKQFVKNFNTDDFSGLLWNEILAEDSFDILSLKLFSLISGEEREKEISASLLSKAANKESLQNNPRAIKKTQDLLTASESFTSENQPVSEVYRNILSSLLKEISFEKELSFDRGQLHTNYLFIMLNLLDEEKDEERLKLVLEGLSKELEGIIREKNFKYLKMLLGVLKKRGKEDPAFASISERLERRISKFAELIIWEEDISADLGYLLDALEKTSSSADFCLDKIFREDKVNPYVLKLFFRFFPEAAPLFYKNLEKKYSDMEFLAKVAGSLGQLEPSLAIEILKYIYAFANKMIKIEALKAMRGLPQFDAEFIFSILQKGDAVLKKEALAILAKDENARKRALERLLFLPSHWGRKNKIIMENIIIIRDLGLREAADYLLPISKKRFFWNKNIRKKALEVLKDWNARQD